MKGLDFKSVAPQADDDAQEEEEEEEEEASEEEEDIEGDDETGDEDKDEEEDAEEDDEEDEDEEDEEDEEEQEEASPVIPLASKPTVAVKKVDPDAKSGRVRQNITQADIRTSPSPAPGHLWSQNFLPLRSLLERLLHMSSTTSSNALNGFWKSFPSRNGLARLQTLLSFRRSCLAVPTRTSCPLSSSLCAKAPFTPSRNLNVSAAWQDGVTVHQGLVVVAISVWRQFVPSQIGG